MIHRLILAMLPLLFLVGCASQAPLRRENGEPWRFFLLGDFDETERAAIKCAIAAHEGVIVVAPEDTPDFAVEGRPPEWPVELPMDGATPIVAEAYYASKKVCEKRRLSR